MNNLEFGGWELREVIGEGAFSKVWRAEKTLDGTNALSAIKVISVPSDEYQLEALRADGLSEQETRDFLYSIVKGYLSEIKLMTALQSCPNIVGLHDCAVHEKESCTGWDILIRMELLTPLDKYAAASPLGEKELVRLGRDICAALCALHKAHPPLIHRDIKPSNIFVSDGGAFKLGDFGAAKEALMSCDSSTRLGVGDYTPPETAASGEYTAQSDIYSLGLVLYKLANGSLMPFVTDRSSPFQRAQAAHKRLDGEPLPLPTGVSTALGEVILKACAFRPQDRYAAADEFSAALGRAVEAPHLISGDNSPKSAVRKALVALPIAAGAAALGISAALLVNTVKGTDIAASTADKSGSSLASITEAQSVPDPQSASDPQSTPDTQDEQPAQAAAEETAESSPQPPQSQPSASVSAADIPTEIPAATSDDSDNSATTPAPTTTAPTTTAPTTSAQTTPAQTTTAPTATAPTTPAQTTPAQPDEATPQEDFATLVSGGRVTITGYKGRSKDVVIPAEIGGLPVTAIGDAAFSRISITSVVIPEGVTSIGSSAFEFSTALCSISLPESLRLIGGNAFYGCSALTELYIPSGVVSIDGLCFGWSGLEKITVAQDNQFYAAADGVLFSRDMAALLFYPPNRRDESYAVPDGVIETGSYAIDRPLYLERLILPQSFRYFSDGRVTGSIREISAQDNPYLCDIDGVLFSADKSTLIAYPSGRTDSDYSIPSGTKVLGTYAFASCGLKRLSIPESVVSVKEYALVMNSALASVEYGGVSYSAAEFMALFGLTTF